MIHIIQYVQNEEMFPREIQYNLKELLLKQQWY